MSREIKFRAWHKKAKAMASWEVLRDLLFGKAVRWPLKLSNVQPYPETITYFEVRSANIFENPDLEVMQFTGLKDKNGREIYEGDIVYSAQWNPERQAVAFDRGGFCLKDDESGYYPDIKYAVQMEIIGNIHESHELLKGDK